MEQLIDLLPLDCYLDNGCFYPAEVLQSAVEEFNERTKDHPMMGECTIPSIMDMERYVRIDISRVSHIVRHVWVDDGYVKCKIQLLGHYAELARELDFDYKGIPRATGVTAEDSGVCSKYTLITVDLALPEGLI